MITQTAKRFLRSTFVLLASLILSSHPSLATAQNNAAVPKEFSSDDYGEVVEEAVRLLVRGDSQEFRKILSPGLITRSERELGKKAVETIINERFIPFFAEFQHLDPNVTTTKTSDTDGHKGLAIYRSYVTKDKKVRPFVVYVLEEDGRLVVGNILINKTLRDISLAEQRK